jgi:hypothetical protein
MRMLIGKLLEYLVLIGVVIGLGFIFLFEIIDLFVIEQIKRKFKGKKSRRKPRRVSK